MNTDEMLPKNRTSFSPKEVACIIQHDVSTILRWCRNGLNGAQKPRGRWIILREAVAAMIVAFGMATHQAPGGTYPVNGNPSYIAQKTPPGGNVPRPRQKRVIDGG